MKKRGFIFTFIVLMFSVLISCENKDDENGENKDMSSSFNENEATMQGRIAWPVINRVDRAKVGL